MKMLFLGSIVALVSLVGCGKKTSAANETKAFPLSGCTPASDGDGFRCPLTDDQKALCVDPIDPAGYVFENGDPTATANYCGVIEGVRCTNYNSVSGVIQYLCRY